MAAIHIQSRLKIANSYRIRKNFSAENNSRVWRNTRELSVETQERKGKLLRKHKRGECDETQER